ncbi:MAG: Uncharacterized protein XD63_1231 [Thermoanaerobacterales bacterium 50_218]|nr:MAG: Uncharacterized protein XD63_1231 [Thermoanaerobacterales bacterium 50_218]
MGKKLLLCLILLCVGTAVLVFLRPAVALEDYLFEESAAIDQGPGSAADPVFTRSSFHSYVEQLLSGVRGELSAIEDRLDRVALQVEQVRERIGRVFPDMKGHWAFEYVSFLQSRGIIGGYPDGNFHPEEPVTRAALAVMILKAKNLDPDPGAAVFPDVPRDHWAAGAIGAVRAAGFLKGYPDGTFRPERELTRAEAAVVLNRAFHPSAVKIFPTFSDLSGHWAAPDVQQLAAAGIIGGYPDGTFRPDWKVKRSELATMLAKILKE